MKGLTLYQNRKVSWNWLAIQINKSVPFPFVWRISNYRPYRQWFAYCSVFPLFFYKNNAEWVFGISFLFFVIQLKYQYK